MARGTGPADRPGSGTADGQGATPRPTRKRPAEVTPIGSLHAPGKATVEGRVISLAIRPVEQNSVLACRDRR